MLLEVLQIDQHVSSYTKANALYYLQRKGKQLRRKACYHEKTIYWPCNFSSYRPSFYLPVSIFRQIHRKQHYPNNQQDQFDHYYCLQITLLGLLLLPKSTSHVVTTQNKYDFSLFPSDQVLSDCSYFHRTKPSLL